MGGVGIGTPPPPQMPSGGCGCPPPGASEIGIIMQRIGVAIHTPLPLSPVHARPHATRHLVACGTPRVGQRRPHRLGHVLLLVLGPANSSHGWPPCYAAYVAACVKALANFCAYP